MTQREIIAEVWPGWKIEEKIGEGSYGKVFKAVKKSGGMMQDSAIKVMRIPEEEKEFKLVQEKFGLNKQEAEEYFYPEIERLKKEILLMKELGEEDNIVRILDFEITKDNGEGFGWYILIRMELLESLESLIKRKNFLKGDVLSLVEDILYALKACEAHNILHRDIKPDNLFYSRQGRYKLGDFGVAKELMENSLSLSHRGTDTYMAPEVYQGKDYSYNADIYSLGIVLYKLFNNNRLPFLGQGKLTAADLEKAFQKRQTGEKLPIPINASEEMFGIIEKMCAFTPKERFQSASEVLDIIKAYRNSHNEEMKQSLGIRHREADESVIRKKESVSTKEENFTESLSEENGLYSEETGCSYIDGTRKLYPGKDTDLKTASENSSSFENIEGVLERMREETDNRKGGFKPWIPAVAFIGIAVILGAVFLNRQQKFQSQATVDETASQISETADAQNIDLLLADDVFALDQSQLTPGSYLAYTIRIWAPGAMEVKERSGIYLGGQINGMPQGFGGFFYQTEGQGEGNSHYLVQNIYIGEWENGLLKPGTMVKQRKKNTLTYENGDVETFIFRFEDIWDGENFRDNMRGSLEYSFVRGENGSEERQSFVGVFDKESTNKLNGTEYTDKQKYVGEYRDNRYYNGTFYSLDGTEIGTVKEGNIQYIQ